MTRLCQFLVHLACGHGLVLLWWHYLVPVLRMTSCFHTMRPMGQNHARKCWEEVCGPSWMSRQLLCLDEFIRMWHWWARSADCDYLVVFVGTWRNSCKEPLGKWHTNSYSLTYRSQSMAPTCATLPIPKAMEWNKSHLQVSRSYCIVAQYKCHILLAICRPSGCTVVSSVVVIVVCNHSQMRTSKCTCLIFSVNVAVSYTHLTLPTNREV